jgi:hypothetical protein
MDSLKLIAFDAEDLAVVSAHVQDAVLKVSDLAFQPKAKRFVALIRRFDWSVAVKPGKRQTLRRQSALRFERVLGARHQGIDLKGRNDVLSLLAIKYDPKSAEDPGGTVTLVFAGGAAIQLDVECIEAELRDLGPTWKARSQPEHPDPATEKAGKASGKVRGA